MYIAYNIESVIRGAQWVPIGITTIEQISITWELCQCEYAKNSRIIGGEKKTDFQTQTGWVHVGQKHHTLVLGQKHHTLCLMSDHLLANPS